MSLVHLQAIGSFLPRIIITKAKQVKVGGSERAVN
jgi:hypothetical protein